MRAPMHDDDYDRMSADTLHLGDELLIRCGRYVIPLDNFSHAVDDGTLVQVVLCTETDPLELNVEESAAFREWLDGLR
jgi:hypothetical protein